MALISMELYQQSKHFFFQGNHIAHDLTMNHGQIMCYVIALEQQFLFSILSTKEKTPYSG